VAWTMSTAKHRIEQKDLKSFELLGNLTPDKLDELLSKSTVEEYPAGRILFRQGERDKRTLFLLSGQVELAGPGNVTSLVVKARTSIAKRPLAHEQPRPYTARSKTNVVVLTVDSDLLDIVTNEGDINAYEVTEISTEEEANDWMVRFLQSQAFLKLPTSNIQALLLCMEEVVYAAGSAVIEEGDSDDYYYIIKEGRCEVSRKGDAAKASALATLGPGDGFGEEALITSARRNATVRMLTDGVLMRLGKDNFNTLLVSALISKIAYSKAQKLIASGSALIDARLPERYADGCLPAAVNMPLAVLRAEIQALEPGQSYVVYCDDGTLSTAAAFLLSQQGLTTFVLEGGLAALGGSVSLSAPAAQPEPAPSAAPAPTPGTTPKAAAPAQPKTGVASEHERKKQRELAALDERVDNAEAAQRKAEEDASRARAEAEALRKRAQQELVRLKREHSAKHEQEVKAALQRAEEEARRAEQAEAEAERVRAEAQAERQRVEQEVRKSAAADRAKREQELAELDQRIHAAEQARREAENEAARVRTEAETLRKQAETDLARLQREQSEKHQQEVGAALQRAEEEARRAAEAEQARREAEAEVARVRAEAAAERLRIEQEAQQAAALEADKARRQAQEEAAKLRQEAETTRRSAETEAQRLKEEAELARAQAEQEAEIAEKRRSMVSTGDRSAKIRTYNFPQSRVTDHRIKLTLHRLDEILDGDLDDIIDALKKHDQAESLKLINNSK